MLNQSCRLFRNSSRAFRKIKMYKLILFLGICSASGLGSKLTQTSKDTEKIVGCYHIIDEPFNDPQPELQQKGVDASLCSHLFYSFVGIGLNGSILGYSLSDVASDPYQYFNGRWKMNPHIKTLVHMAPLNDVDSDHPVNVLTDPHMREIVVNNIVNFVKKHEFNGIDLDLKTPLQIYDLPTNKEGLVLLLKALKGKFDEEGFILCVSVDPREDIAKKLYDIKGISAYVKFINLMAFNFNEPLDEPKKPSVGHTSPLYHSSKDNAEERKNNIDYVVKYWIRNGAPANKLILGTYFTSEVSFTLANPKQIGRGAPFVYGGQYSFSKYSEICAFLKQPEWKYFFDKEQQVPYLYKGNQTLPYDDVASIKAKAEYVNKMKLGGVVAQYLEEDDVGGKCGEKFALLKTLNRVLRNKA